MSNSGKAVFISLSAGNRDGAVDQLISDIFPALAQRASRSYFVRGSGSLQNVLLVTLLGADTEDADALTQKTDQAIHKLRTAYTTFRPYVQLESSREPRHAFLGARRSAKGLPLPDDGGRKNLIEEFLHLSSGFVVELLRHEQRVEPIRKDLAPYLVDAIATTFDADGVATNNASAQWAARLRLGDAARAHIMQAGEHAFRAGYFGRVPNGDEWGPEHHSALLRWQTLLISVATRFVGGLTFPVLSELLLNQLGFDLPDVAYVGSMVAAAKRGGSDVIGAR